ncbi:GPR1/FUN34/YaaH-class plasma membrane protein-like protein [Xylariaceae sp. FL1019]|nr:GPR1/FUN34/YaaH-class plasma membrane protein-like protein [Xylariaceae sp. FL1019]
MENGNGIDVKHDDFGANNLIRNIQTNGSISMPPEMFEKLYLSPQNRVKGELRKTLGNPTPIGIVGFVISLGPLACDLMGWRGAGGSGAASIPFFIFFGGLLLFVGGFFELLLGNTFPSVVFFTFASFYFSYGCVLLPQFNAYALYAPPGEAAATGLATQGFNASFGFITLSMGIMSFLFLICAVRTNIVFVVIFVGLTTTFGLITGAYFQLASDYVGNAALAGRLLTAAGAFSFVTTAAGWWILFALMLSSVDFPFALPVGDLSTKIRGASDRKQAEV